MREKETSRMTKPNKTQTLASKNLFGPAEDAEELTITTHVVATAAFCCGANIDTKPMPQNKP